MESARSDEKGFSLIEIMVAMMVLLIVFMGLMRAALVAIDINARSNIRQESVNVANMSMNTAKNLPFDDLVTAAGAPPAVTAVNREFRSIDGGITYTTTRTVTILDADNLQVDLMVNWSWRDVGYSFTKESIVRNPS